MKASLAYVWEHRRHLPALSLVAGFVLDLLTIGRPDGLYANVVILAYVALAGLGILWFSYLRERGKHTKRYGIWVLAGVQFMFGNMASALFALYSGSGTFVGSWLFLLILLGLLVGNELIKNRYGELRFNLAVYYALVFSYCIVAVPVLVRSLGPWIFLASGLASLGFIALFLLLLRLAARGLVEHERKILPVIIGAIFVLFNGLYFLNLIPPVPLSLPQLGLYHSITRSEDGYLATYEHNRAWYAFWKRSDEIFHMQGADRAYCWSAVFAPPRLSTTVRHVWEYFNPKTGEWETQSEQSLAILGGRPDGYRVYTWKTILQPGDWRCSVESENGALIGRITFTAVLTNDPLDLSVTNL